MNLKDKEAVLAMFETLKDSCTVLHEPEWHPPVFSFFISDPDGYKVEFQKILL